MNKAKLMLIIVLLRSCGSPWDIENSQGNVLFKGESYMITQSKDNENSYMVLNENSWGGVARAIDPEVHVGNIEALEFYTGCEIITNSVRHEIVAVSYAVVDC